jgi:Cobalamin biosynthesis protein CobN and related Mg-chelatases
MEAQQYKRKRKRLLVEFQLAFHISGDGYIGNSITTNSSTSGSSSSTGSSSTGGGSSNSTGDSTNSSSGGGGRSSGSSSSGSGSRSSPLITYRCAWYSVTLWKYIWS